MSKPTDSLTTRPVSNYELELPFPPSLNQYRVPFRHSRTKKLMLKTSPEGKAYKQEVVSLIKNAPFFNHKVHVSIILQPRTKHTFDVDNYLKALLDALTEAKVWKDDSLVHSLYVEKGEPVKGGKVFIKIWKK